MSDRIHVAIATQALSVQDAMVFVADPAHGAADVFVGAVRNHNLGKPVRGVSYDVFDALCLTVFEAIARSAQQHWGDDLKIYIEHFKGRLDIGGLSVVIAVSSKHREESFAACRYVIEAIKHQAPVWKQEHYVDGDSDWVKGHVLCAHVSVNFSDFLPPIKAA
jgi:molybdopterin synthase catalytic subunit